LEKKKKKKKKKKKENRNFYGPSENAVGGRLSDTYLASFFKLPLWLEEARTGKFLIVVRKILCEACIPRFA